MMRSIMKTSIMHYQKPNRLCKKKDLFKRGLFFNWRALCFLLLTETAGLALVPFADLRFLLFFKSTGGHLPA